MSEGVDLQLASATVLLDMPSVLRIVEQRLGRSDRLDSPFSEISTYWPNDSEEYSLKGDRRLVEINKIVEDAIGSNIEVPSELRFRHFSKVDSVAEMQQEYIDHISRDDTWDGIHNSIQPIVQLKEGGAPLIDAEEYEHIVGVSSYYLKREFPLFEISVIGVLLHLEERKRQVQGGFL